MRVGQELFERTWREPQELLLCKVMSSRPGEFSKVSERWGCVCPQACILGLPLCKSLPPPPKALDQPPSIAACFPKHPLCNRRGCQAAASSLWLLPSPSISYIPLFGPFSLHTLTFLLHQLSAGSTVAGCFEPPQSHFHAGSLSVSPLWPGKMFTTCLASSRPSLPPQLHSASAWILSFPSCTSASCDYVT